MKTNHLLIALVAFSTLLLAGCSSSTRVGPLQSESKTVELGDANAARVEIDFGAGNLEVSGGAEKLLEANFTYNVTRLKPVVEYSDGILIVRQPEVNGLPALGSISDFRNEWELRLYDDIPMDLRVNMGAGTSNLKLDGLWLTGLDVILGAGESTVDLSGAWIRDLDITIDAGAADIRVLLPGDVGVRVEVDAGPTMVETSGLIKDGNVYTNSVYGNSEVTIQVNMNAGIGRISLEVEEHAQSEAVLQNLLDEQVQKQGILGMAMALRLADSTVIQVASGYTDPSGTEHWTANTATQIASVTKTFTAVVVMQLVEEGKLSLDDTVDTWFPEQPKGDKITVRMLLSHTSSLADFSSAFGIDLDKWSKDWTPEELIAEANKSGLVGVPGGGVFHYSNTNYIMLGRIIEKVTGNSWEHEIESRIIKPLDLKNTTWVNEDNWKEKIVPSYLKTSDGYLNISEHPWYSQVSPSVAWAAGGIGSSISDLMTFVSALFDGRLVSKETLELMSQPVGTGYGRAYALGGFVTEVDGHKAFAMDGDTPGYHAFFIGTLDGKFIVTALVNSDGDVISPSMAVLQQYISGQQ